MQVEPSFTVQYLDPDFPESQCGLITWLPKASSLQKLYPESTLTCHVSSSKNQKWSLLPWYSSWKFNLNFTKKKKEKSKHTTTTFHWKHAFAINSNTTCWVTGNWPHPQENTGLLSKLSVNWAKICPWAKRFSPITPAEAQVGSFGASACVCKMTALTFRPKALEKLTSTKKHKPNQRTDWKKKMFFFLKCG